MAEDLHPDRLGRRGLVVNTEDGGVALAFEAELDFL